MSRYRPEDLPRLAAGYTPAQARLNRAAIAGFVLLGAVAGGLIALRNLGQPWWAWVALVGAGVALADLLTGLVHWASDTWGTPETPVVGRLLVRSFREHHLAPSKITEHDWAQTNGEQCLPGIPVMAGLVLWGAMADATTTRLGEALFLYVAVIAAAAATQIHKWAHSQRPPFVVRGLQRARLILPRSHHARHHRNPFLTRYCITTGWWNPLLDTVGFWRGLEWVVYRLTQAVPREDELGPEEAAGTVPWLA
jgi:ubiquitin-conjugating enzyme E2 variant